MPSPTVIRPACESFSPTMRSKKTSIHQFLRVSRPTIDAWIRRFEAEHFAGLMDKSSAPHAPACKVWLPLMVQVYHLQKAYPDAGRFRIWSLLARPDLSEPPSATSWPSISSSIPTSRTTNRWGCVTLHSYHFYVEAGLPQTQGLLWVAGTQLRAAFDHVILPEYSCRYDWRHQRGHRLRNCCSSRWCRPQESAPFPRCAGYGFFPGSAVYPSPFQLSTGQNEAALYPWSSASFAACELSRPRPHVNTSVRSLGIALRASGRSANGI
jgi:hypothetical protein